MTERELAWATGFFEGEGTIRISRPALRNWGTLIASATNTDRTVIEWFQARWPGYCKPASGLSLRQRPAWVWLVAARRAAAFLNQIQPYVIRRRVRARIEHALWFQNQKRSRTGNEAARLAYAEAQWNAHWWMRELNHRGPGGIADEVLDEVLYLSECKRTQEDT